MIRDVQCRNANTVAHCASLDPLTFDVTAVRKQVPKGPLVDTMASLKVSFSLVASKRISHRSQTNTE